MTKLLKFLAAPMLMLVLALALAACNSGTPEGETPKEEAPKAAAPATTTQPSAQDTQTATTEQAEEDIVYLDLKDGRVTIRLRPDLAPNHVAQIKTLVGQGFYDGIVFHRVIDGFMAQTGDPTGTGTGGSELPDIKAEFTGEPFKRGVLGMARAADPDSANSQFFIMFADGDFLNGQYTVFGEVTGGMEHVDKIKRGTGQNGMVSDPDKIIKMTLASDAG